MLVARWHQGLYRRIALGCVALVIVILAVEAALLGIVTWRWGKGFSPTDRMIRVGASRAIAFDLERDLEAAPNLDLAAWFDRPSSARGRVFLILKDGRQFGPVPDGLAAEVVDRLQYMRDDAPLPEFWKRSAYSASLVTPGDRLVGVLGTVPMSTWARFGPLFAGVGIAVLGFGVVGISLMVVRPIRSRLSSLATAANQLEGGDLDARAPDDGSDEVAAVARAVNGMADELIRRTTALEVSDRLRRQLLADVSHELMTPLTAVLGHLETLMMEDITLDEVRRRKQLAVASREAQRLQRVIGDLLDVARLEDGGLHLLIEDVSPAEVFRDVVERHELECRSRRLLVTSRVSPGAETVEADRFRLEQALNNLVANALRHTPDCGSISLTADGDEDDIVLSVNDSGQGIPETHLPYVFDRFYKVSASSGIASPGSGLGLAIVKAIAHRHGGHVRAASRVGVGTTVSIVLPRQTRLRPIRPHALDESGLLHTA